MYFAVPILRPGVPGGAWSLSTFITFCHRQNKTKALDHMFFLLQNRHPLNNRMEDMSATPTGKNRAEPISCLSILVNFISLLLCLTQSTDENTWVEKMKYKWIHPKRIKERKSRSRTFDMDKSSAIAGSIIVFSHRSPAATAPRMEEHILGAVATDAWAHPSWSHMPAHPTRFNPAQELNSEPYSRVPTSP